MRINEPFVTDESADERLLKATEVQLILGFSRAHVYRLMKDHTLPTVRIRGSVRVPYRELRRWIEVNTMPGARQAG